MTEVFVYMFVISNNSVMSILYFSVSQIIG